METKQDNELFLHYMANVNDVESMKEIELKTDFPSVSHAAFSEE
jgi:hypothetical protein